MFGLHELFEKQIDEMFRPNKLYVRILENRLEGIGLILTEQQRLDFEEQVGTDGNDILIFDFSDQQIEEAGFSSEDDLEPKLREIVESLLPTIEKFMGSIDETMHSLVESVTDDMAESVVSTLEERIDDMLADQVTLTDGVCENIQSIWGVPLSWLQGLIVISEESVSEYVARSDKYPNYDINEEILVSIHAKAVLIAKEILTLLKNGFPDGAQARWRTLHELAVTSSFIADRDGDVAKRYVDHEAVEVYKAALQYNEYYAKLHTQKISPEEMENMEQDYIRLLDKYGQSYKYDYGWAAKELGLKKPTFRDIEAVVQLDHHRPYYKVASANVHANPVGVFNRLGLLPEEDVILSGPSNVGLTEPAQSTVLSLNIITMSVMAYRTDFDLLTINKVLHAFGSKVEDAFLTVESEILEYAYS